ncbi:MAG: VWA domain-containing protein [Pseudomonadota bacterium]
MKKRRDISVMGLSFLDVISCGFGAIVLLLVLTKVAEPLILELSTNELRGRIASLEAELFKLRGEARLLNRTRISKQQQLSQERDKIARLQGDLSEIQGKYAASIQRSDIANILTARLASAKQQLSEEMKRLLGADFRRTNDTVGGIPVDSEYVIFVIDTSGSMYNYAWNMVMEKISQTLQIYPKLKGIQVMNDMGSYMFQRYRGQWIPDTPARRKAIIKRLSSWNPFSNSSPVEGITEAIRSFYTPGKKISIYVFGDEYTGGSIATVIDTIEQINKQDQNGKRMVRIHAVGFPVQFAQQSNRQITGIRFATLMRLLTHRNGGSFVGLNNFRP